jgi:hypothetical protein
MRTQGSVSERMKNLVKVGRNWRRKIAGTNKPEGVKDLRAFTSRRLASLDTALNGIDLHGEHNVYLDGAGKFDSTRMRNK